MRDVHILAPMNLKEWRTQHAKLTMAQAVEQLGISQPTISRIENGEQFPSPETIELLAIKTEGLITADDLHGAWKQARETSSEAEQADAA